MITISKGKQATKQNRWRCRMIERFVLCLAVMSFFSLKDGKRWWMTKTKFFGFSLDKHRVGFVSDKEQGASRNTSPTNNKSLKSIHQENYSNHDNNNIGRYLLYIRTTIFSEGRQQFLEYCWPELLKTSRFLQEADVLIFSNSVTQVNSTTLSLVQQLFSNNPSFQFECPPSS